MASEMNDGLFGQIYFNQKTGKSTVLLESLPTFSSVVNWTVPEALSYVYDLELSNFALDRPSDLILATRRIGE